MKADLLDKTTAEKQLLADIKNLKQNLSTQKLSMAKRNQLLQNLSETKSILQTKKQNIRDLNEMGNDKEILLSNLIQKKCANFDTINNLVHNMSSELNAVGLSKCSLNPSLFDLKSNSKETYLNEQLQELSEAVKQSTLEYEHVSIYFKGH